jgi:hypothetical protein
MPPSQTFCCAHSANARDQRNILELRLLTDARDDAPLVGHVVFGSVN